MSSLFQTVNYSIRWIFELFQIFQTLWTSKLQNNEEIPNFLLINLLFPLTIMQADCKTGGKASRGRRSRCAKFKVPSGQKEKWKNFCCISTTSRRFPVASFTLSNHGRSTFSLSSCYKGEETTRKRRVPILLDVRQNHVADSHANLPSVSRTRLSDLYVVSRREP